MSHKSDNAQISRRGFLASTGAMALAASSGAALANQVQKHRNIVFILIDDQRFDALGFENPYFTTPAMDALAKEGVVFDRTFVTTSLCSPSRASILSGQYMHRHGVTDNNRPLPDGTPTFPQELQKAGYRTGFVGKWHMGGSSDDPRPGFERWVSFRGQGPYRNPTFNIDGERVPHEGYTTDLITDYSEQFLRQQDDRPFFLYMSHKAVHADFSPAERHKGIYKDRPYPYPETMADTEENYKGKPNWVRAQRNSWHGVDGLYNNSVTFDEFTNTYAECLMGVDDSLQRIVDTLKDLGLLESTLLVFTSDNGFKFGEHGLIDKRSMYEASIRVPLIVHCPEICQPGQRRSEMALNIDFAPTILEAAGLQVPDTMQGKSLLPVIKGEDVEWRDAWLYEYFWERNFPQTPTVLGVRTDRYKLMHYHGVWDRYEMYDLETDPDERNNLLGEFLQVGEGGTLDRLIANRAPEETRELFVRLSKRLNELLEETGCNPDPSWAKQ